MTIHFEDFAKLDIRIGTVISVERVPDTDKLLRFMVEIGTETRQIIAGMAQFHRDLDEIPGKQIPVLVNIAPRMYRSLESQMACHSGRERAVPHRPRRPFQARSLAV